MGLISFQLPSFKLPHLSGRTRKACARVFSDSPSPSQAFEKDLAVSLQQLMQKGGSDAYPSSADHDLLSLTWMCKALDVAISAHSSAMQALQLTHCTPSTSTSRSHTLSESKIMQQYVEDSIKMLDVCALVKKTMAAVGADVKASHLALKRLQGLRLANQGDVQRAKRALLSAKHAQDRVLLEMADGAASIHTNVQKSTILKRQQLSMCSSMLRRMGDNIPAPPSTTSDHPLADQLQEHNVASTMACSALYGGEMCTIFFLRLLSTALSSSPACHKAMTPLHLSGQATAWAPSLLSLHAQLNSKLLRVAAHKQSHRQHMATLIPELHILQASMNQIYEVLLEGSMSSKQEAHLKHLVNSTSLLSHHLQGSAARLERQIECLHSSLLNTRMALLQ